jgi:hypothetical protein
MNLYLKTIARTYTAEYLAKWPRTRGVEITTHPVWAESEQAVRENHRESMGEYWDDKFEDVLAGVERMDVDAERARMLRADRTNRRCCDNAVLRPCVCLISFTCAEHGDRCVGSHD